MSAAGLPPAMRARKAWRVAGDALRSAGLDIADAWRTGHNHLAVMVGRAERRATITLSCSPRDAENMARAAVRDARRRLGRPA